jgi:hypothetical protein
VYLAYQVSQNAKTMLMVDDAKRTGRLFIVPACSRKHPEGYEPAKCPHTRENARRVRQRACGLFHVKPRPDHGHTPDPVSPFA